MNFSIADFLSGDFGNTASVIWDAAMLLIQAVLTRSPSSFSAEAWSYIQNTLWPLFMSVGVLLMNTLILINLCKTCSNLKQNITLEVVIEGLIQIVAANCLMQILWSLINTVMNMGLSMVASVGVTTFTLPTQDFDVGTSIFILLFGIAYICVIVASAWTILKSVYSRFIQIYILVAVGPVAIATIAGGRGINQTAFSWIRTFIGKTIEVALIAMVLAICSKVTSNVSLFDFTGGVAEVFDGFGLMVQKMAMVGITAGCVKGVDQFLRRALSL